MTVREAITRADSIRRNEISEQEKKAFLAELEMKIKNAVTDQYEQPAATAPDGQAEETLAVNEPYTDIYVYWLLSKIAILEGDTEQYNQWNALFQQSYRSFFNDFNCAHRRKRCGNFKF